jgi:hypothetical protein
MQAYIFWALLGMVGYSFTTLFVKLAERSAAVSSYMVLAVSTTIVLDLRHCHRRHSWRAQAAHLRPGAGDPRLGHRRRYRADRRGEFPVPCAVAWAGQCGGAHLWHVHHRRLAARCAGPGGADDLEQNRGPCRRRPRRGPHLVLAEVGSHRCRRSLPRLERGGGPSVMRYSPLTSKGR